MTLMTDFDGSKVGMVRSVFISFRINPSCWALNKLKPID